MEVDEALMKLGKLGRWHLIYYTVLSTCVMLPAAWHAIIIVYIGYKPDHRCLLNDTLDADVWIPRDNNGVAYSCEMYSDVNAGNETQPCNNGWYYNLPDGNNVITEWDLVCDKAYFSDLSQSLFVIGVMLGSLIFPPLADYFGRKRIFFCAQPLMMGVGIATTISNNVYIFFVLRLLMGVVKQFIQGVILSGYVLAVEMFSSKYRTFAGIMINNFWAIAWSIFPLFAFLIKEWRYLQLFVSLFSLLILPFYCIISESVPWLYANNRIDEAEAIIRKAARINSIQMQQQILLKQSGANEIKPLTIISSKNEQEIHKNGNKSVYTIIDVVKNRRLLKHGVIMSILWMIISLVYYGLSLSTAKLAGDRYLNGFLNAVVEIPAYTSSILIANRIGRRYSLVGYHLLAGVALICIQIIPYLIADKTSAFVLNIILYNIGKLGITASYGIVYLYTQELFPTTFRSQSIGIISFFARIGHFSSTFTPYVIEIIPWLPRPLFGILSAGGGLLVLLLPETLNKALPNTINDIEDWYKKPITQNT